MLLVIESQEINSSFIIVEILCYVSFLMWKFIIYIYSFFSLIKQKKRKFRNKFVWINNCLLSNCTRDYKPLRKLMQNKFKELFFISLFSMQTNLYVTLTALFERAHFTMKFRFWVFRYCNFLNLQTMVPNKKCTLNVH